MAVPDNPVRLFRPGPRQHTHRLQEILPHHGLLLGGNHGLPHVRRRLHNSEIHPNPSRKGSRKPHVRGRR